jgi:hypothetical protein
MVQERDKAELSNPGRVIQSRQYPTTLMMREPEEENTQLLKPTHLLQAFESRSVWVKQLACKVRIVCVVDLNRLSIVINLVGACKGHAFELLRPSEKGLDDSGMACTCNSQIRNW